MWYHWNIFVRTMNSTASDPACVETIWREPMTWEMIEMTLQNSLDIFRSHGVMETCCWPENSIEEGSLSPSNSPVSVGISTCPDVQQAASCQKPSSSFRHAVPKIIKSPRGRYFNSNLRAILLPIRIIVWTCMDWINHADVFLPRFGAVPIACFWGNFGKHTCHLTFFSNQHLPHLLTSCDVVLCHPFPSMHPTWWIVLRFVRCPSARQAPVVKIGWNYCLRAVCSRGCAMNIYEHVIYSNLTASTGCG